MSKLSSCLSASLSPDTAVKGTPRLLSAEPSEHIENVVVMSTIMQTYSMPGVAFRVDCEFLDSLTDMIQDDPRSAKGSHLALENQLYLKPDTSAHVRER